MRLFLRIAKNIFATAVLLLIIQGCYEEQTIVEESSTEEAYGVMQINQADGFVDVVNRFIMYPLPSETLKSFAANIHFFNYTTIRFEGRDLVNDRVNDFGEVRVNHPYQVIAAKDDLLDTFQLIFTSLPLIHIRTDEEISDEPKILSSLSLNYYAENNPDEKIKSFNTFAGIEYRGATSQNFEKKSFGFELWRNRERDDYSASLLGMRPCEDWILDAMYVDDIRMRNKYSFELWEKIGNTPEEDMKTEVIPGIQSRYVELFLNNRYHGLYCLNEKLDEKLLHISRNQNDKGGVLYKAISWGSGSTTFDTYHTDPPFGSKWDGWELIYPDDFSAWEALSELRKFVVNSNDDEFRNGIAARIDMDNLIRYYLFLNLTLAYDNAGKNTYMARYTDESRFFIIPWDMDASFGLFWDGTRIESSGIASYQLYKRLIDTDADDFNRKLAEKWTELRTGDLAEKALLDPLAAHYALLKNSGAIERENARWESIQIDLDDGYQFTSGWIKDRLKYLDDYFK